MATGKTAYFIERRGYAVITADEDVAKSLVKKGAGLDKKISPELGAKLLASDLQSVEIQVRPYTFVEFDHIALQHR